MLSTNLASEVSIILALDNLDGVLEEVIRTIIGFADSFKLGNSDTLLLLGQILVKSESIILLFLPRAAALSRCIGSRSLASCSGGSPNIISTRSGTIASPVICRSLSISVLATIDLGFQLRLALVTAPALVNLLFRIAVKDSECL